MTPPNVAVYNWIRRGLDFDGRASRSDFWWPRLFVFTINLVLMFLFATGLGAERTVQVLEWLGSQPTSFEGSGLTNLPSLSLFALVFGSIFGLLTFIPDLSLAWRRFHDLDRPGWLHLIFLIGGAFFVLVAFAEFIWFAFPGTRGPNAYGPDPLDRWV